MDHMTLIATVTELDMLLLQVLRHADHFYPFPRSGLNNFVVAAQTEINHLISPDHGQGSDLFAVFDVVAVGAMTNFTGDGFVHTVLVNGSNRLVTGKAGVIGTQTDRNGFLVLNVRTAVMSILSHAFGDKDFSGYQAENDHNDQGNKQSNQMGVVFSLRILLHAASPSVFSMLPELFFSQLFIGLGIVTFIWSPSYPVYVDAVILLRYSMDFAIIIPVDYRPNYRDMVKR